MKRLKIAGLTVLAVAAMGTAASAATAHEFVASEASKLVGTATATQVFTTAAGKVECTKLEVTSGTSTKGSVKTQTATIQYTGCKAFGLSATISPAEYEFNAEGTVSVLKAITIKATGCTVSVPVQSALKTITYSNSGKGISISPNVTGITSEGTGTACTYAKEAKGTYTGTSLVTLSGGGTVEWK